MKFTIKVWRQKNAKTKGHFETYKVDNISPDSSFLEMLDILNDQLVSQNADPVAFSKGCKDGETCSGEQLKKAKEKGMALPISFDHDCREGICGACSLYINGRAHGPENEVTTCQLFMRKFKDGST
ncbi:MAG: 2Fe-2S iron-sulfur cluster binding domain-containing protein, partial [Bacteroidales bacterium]|nr:2Fe-2S iron-sulfur cluster binding domain-containing protein [Bacteroidales bacterium]